MAGESDYDDAVPEYEKKSRFPILSRYQDLILLVKAAFADNRITSAELHQIEAVEKDILLEYQVAADVFFKMDRTMPHYGAASRLLSHLHRCNVFMQYASKQAREKFYADSTFDPERSKLKEIIPMKLPDNKVINLSVSTTGYKLLKELDEPKKRIEAELPQIRRNLSHLSPDERIDLEAKINALVEQLKDRQLEQLSVYELNRLIGLEQYLGEEKQHVREA